MGMVEVPEPGGYEEAGWVLDAGWVDDAAGADPPTPLRYTVRLRESNLPRLRAAALAVSDPASPRYGKFLTGEQIADMTAPSREHLASTLHWVRGERGCAVTVKGDNASRHLLHVSCHNVRAAERLFRTKFRRLRHVQSRQTTLRAGKYSVPAGVLTVFGLHDLPHWTPPPEPVPLSGAAEADSAVKVTPAVILANYNATNIAKVRPNTTNKQAVVSIFGAQTMAPADLETFFSTLVQAKYRPGVDDKVSRFVGAPGTVTPAEVIQREASLDIQYIMGVAPGIPTEFWKFAYPASFCGMVHNWTTTLVDEPNPPLVNSLSYGWQGNLSKIGCLDAMLDAVDIDLTKIAAKGLSVIVASGDYGSGSGGGQRGDCLSTVASLYYLRDTALQGVVQGGPFLADGPEACCAYAGGKAFSYMGQDPTLQCATHPGAPGTVLSGPVLTNLSVPGTLPPTLPPAYECCATFQRLFTQGVAVKGWNFIPAPPEEADASSPGICSFLKEVTGNTTTPATGAASGAALPKGTCTVFHSVNGSSTKKGVLSRPYSVLPLWASWPATSPWVTAVGATRFADEEDDRHHHHHHQALEVASSQFGSGGGFSSRRDADHGWQKEATAGYVSKVAAAGSAHPYPPSSAYDPTARAIPDVSALGEGYQIVVNQTTVTIGGTSAATPAFAALISLLNEARLQAGRPPLGFLNPWLAKGGCSNGWDDVLAGTNAIDKHGGPEVYGWNCTQGWDAVTGFGTPNLGRLLECALSEK